MSGLFDKRGGSRAERREQVKLERQELAHRQAQALKHRITEYENKHDMDERPNALRSGNRLLTLVLFLALAISLLLAMTLGVMVYRNLAVHHAEQNTLREQVSIIANSVHMLDASDAVSVRTTDDGLALVLSEDVDGQKFETRYYLHNGNVMQEYLLASAPINPDSASVVCASSIFDVQVSGSMVTITTDAGSSRVFLRSAQGGGK